MNTRRKAITGTAWRITPTDESEKAKEIADTLEVALKNADEGMRDNFNDLSMAVLPGVATSEIVWKEEGKSFSVNSIDGDMLLLIRHYWLSGTMKKMILLIE